MKDSSFLKKCVIHWGQERREKNNRKAQLISFL